GRRQWGDGAGDRRWRERGSGRGLRADARGPRGAPGARCRSPRGPATEPPATHEGPHLLWIEHLPGEGQGRRECVLWPGGLRPGQGTRVPGAERLQGAGRGRRGPWAEHLRGGRGGGRAGEEGHLGEGPEGGGGAGGQGLGGG